MVHISLKGYMKLRSEAKGTFERMLDLLFERDPYTARHSEEVAELSEKIARKMGLPDEEVEVIRSAARIHDIGKISIPDKILFKPGSLNDEEWEVIKKHPIIGADLLQGLEIYTEAVEIVKYEHERWDGSGYPEGLKGEAIPLGARIVAVADVYSALISDRPYRKAYSKEEARKLMEEMRGTKLDPQVVDALFKAIEED
jgi:putative nucleotidyltransferase with HDIG domain